MGEEEGGGKGGRRVSLNDERRGRSGSYNLQGQLGECLDLWVWFERWWRRRNGDSGSLVETETRKGRDKMNGDLDTSLRSTFYHSSSSTLHRSSSPSPIHYTSSYPSSKLLDRSLSAFLLHITFSLRASIKLESVVLTFVPPSLPCPLLRNLLQGKGLQEAHVRLISSFLPSLRDLASPLVRS